MKKLIVLFSVLSVTLPAMADPAITPNPETYCQIVKARKESQQFALEFMNVCMKRGDGVKDWTDADDQVFECRKAAMGYSGTFVDSESALTFGYADFLHLGGDPNTCKLDKK